MYVLSYIRKICKFMYTLYVWNKEKYCIKFFITDWLLSYAFQLHRLNSVHERHIVMSDDKVTIVIKEMLAHFMMTSWCQFQQAK